MLFLVNPKQAEWKVHCSLSFYEMKFHLSKILHGNLQAGGIDFAMRFVRYFWLLKALWLTCIRFLWYFVNIIYFIGLKNKTQDKICRNPIYGFTRKENQEKWTAYHVTVNITEYVTVHVIVIHNIIIVTKMK